MGRRAQPCWGGAAGGGDCGMSPGLGRAAGARTLPTTSASALPAIAGLNARGAASRRLGRGANPTATKLWMCFLLMGRLRCQGQLARCGRAGSRCDLQRMSRWQAYHSSVASIGGAWATRGLFAVSSAQPSRLEKQAEKSTTQQPRHRHAKARWMRSRTVISAARSRSSNRQQFRAPQSAASRAGRRSPTRQLALGDGLACGKPRQQQEGEGGVGHHEGRRPDRRHSVRQEHGVRHAAGAGHPRHRLRRGRASSAEEGGASSHAWRTPGLAWPAAAPGLAHTAPHPACCVGFQPVKVAVPLPTWL